MSAPSTTVRVPSVAPITCPACGAPITQRTFGRAVTLACGQCGTALDPAEPALARALEGDAKANRIVPTLALGTRGTFRGESLQIVGFMVRQIRVDEVPYRWREYLLFHPVHGYRYLVEYDGHWSLATVLPGAPEGPNAKSDGYAKWGELRCRHFQRAVAEVVFVLGEFPWTVRVGDTAIVDDFVAPPHGLSAESADGEVSWSRAEYVEPAEVYTAFAPTGTPPARRGVYSTQPNRWAGKVDAVWRTFVISILLLCALAFVRGRMAASRIVYEQQGVWTQVDTAAFVTPVFTLEGGPANVSLRTWAGLQNQWLFAGYALINDETGEAFEVGRDLGYWSGVDSDGSWSEGSRDDEAYLSAVPPGRYFLRVELDGPPSFDGINWRFDVTRDAPRAFWWLLAAAALLLPPVAIGIAYASFEGQRWRESDYAPVNE